MQVGAAENQRVFDEWPKLFTNCKISYQLIFSLIVGDHYQP